MPVRAPRDRLVVASASSPLTWVLAAPFLALAWLGCAASPDATSGEVQFRVESARLGQRFVAHGAFALNAPAGWEPVPDSILARVMSSVSSRDLAENSPRLRAVYRQDGGAALAISEFPPELDAGDRASMLKRVTSELRARYPGARVEPSRFRYRGFAIQQVMLNDTTRVVFKLLVERPGSRLYQLDYVVPLGIYRREMQSVESSIGSLETRS